jgi:response regulator RpfG family c-di-GMP phosphodiesterase
MPPHFGVLNVKANHTPVNREQKKVLIVEDNSDMRDLLCKDCLEGYRREATLILMDMMIPVMDGWEAARALRANPDTKNISILATTALFRPHELKTCLEAGCNGCQTV